MKKILVYTFLYVSLLSCGLSKKKKAPLWTGIDSPTQSINVRFAERYFEMHPSFLDSLLGTEDTVMLDVPSMNGMLDSYSFWEIYPDTENTRPNIRGFMGVKKNEPNTYLKLYEDNGKLSGRWDLPTIQWILRYSEYNGKQFYILTDLNNQKQRAPEKARPLEEY